MNQRIVSTDSGLSVVTIRDDGERRIEIALDDCGDFVDLRLGTSPTRSETMAVTPELAQAIYDWLGRWLAAQSDRPGAVPGAGSAHMPDADAWVRRQMGSNGGEV